MAESYFLDEARFAHRYGDYCEGSVRFALVTLFIAGLPAEELWRTRLHLIQFIWLISFIT